MIIERIKRKIEPNMCITPRTTPVIYFGNYEKARACTISLNPSDREFLDGNNQLLPTDRARLCSREELGKRDDEELSESDAIKVKKACDDYFNKKPFVKFFHPFNIFLNEFWKYSYFNDTCVHLDMVQWATTPRWSRIRENNIKRTHLDRDLPVLRYLLEKKFEVIFLNGRTVFDTLSDPEYLNIRLEIRQTMYRDVRGNNHEFIGYLGNYNGAVVKGWNLFYPRGVEDDYTSRSNFWDAIKNMN